MIAPTDDNLRRACATEPLVRWLVAAAKRRTTVTCGTVAARLENECGFGRIFPARRAAVAANAAMERILHVEAGAPILVSLLVRADTRLPESGVEKYFRQTPGAGPLPLDRETFEQVAWREQQRVYSYDNWNRIYVCAFGGGADDADRVSPLIPNDETIAAIEAARRGQLVAVDSIDRLMEDLNAND